jgi:hypothetical protein
MQPFEPIKILGVIEREVGKPRNDHTPGSALYEVPFKLSRSAPAEWGQLFVNAWDHPSSFTSSHRPGICSVSDDHVWLNRTTLEEVEKTHKPTLMLALEEANTKYAELAAREYEAKEKQKQKDEAHRQHVSEAAKKIKFD